MATTANYIVGALWTNKDGETTMIYEKLHNTVEDALADYNERVPSERRLVICKVLKVKTVIVDYDAAGPLEVPIGE